MSNLRLWLEKQLPEEREHFLREIPRLWLEGGEFKKLYRLLSNYDFIEAKINHPDFGIQTLIEDYNLIENIEFSNNPEYNAEIVKSLNLISNALFRSTPILSEDKKQLAAQLSGRLLNNFQELDVINKLLQQISQTPTTCLRCLTASLTPPGIPLIRTLTGHSSSVNALALSSDGKYLVSGSSDTTLKVWDLATGKEIRISATRAARCLRPPGTTRRCAALRRTRSSPSSVIPSRRCISTAVHPPTSSP